nr:hypothetical protein CFP56_33405 [Quercus suber]
MRPPRPPHHRGLVADGDACRSTSKQPISGMQSLVIPIKASKRNPGLGEKIYAESGKGFFSARRIAIRSTAD